MKNEIICTFASTLDVDISLALELNTTVDHPAVADQAESCLLSASAGQAPEDLAPEEHLVQAILLQAVTDWRCAVEALRIAPGDHDAIALKRETENFFRSRWFRMLIDLDGEELLQRLKKEQRLKASSAPKSALVPPRLKNLRRSLGRKKRRQAG